MFSPSDIHIRQLNKPMCILANYAGPLLILLSSNNLGKVRSIPAGELQQKTLLAFLPFILLALIKLNLR